MNAAVARQAVDADAAATSILQLRSSAGLYGADRMVLSLDDGLRGLGARSRLLSIRNYRMDHQPLHDAALAGGGDPVLLPCSGRIDLRTVRALTAQIDCDGADVLHAHDYKSATYAWLATRRRRHVRLVATLHGWVDTSRALRLYNAMEIALLRRFDALVVVAQAQVARLQAAGIAHRRIHRIDNGIALPVPRAERCAALRSELGLADAGVVIAAVGRLSAEKNLSMLLTTFATIAADHPDATLLLVGDGPQRGALEAQCDCLGITARVRFAGVRADMPRIYPLIDCLVLPSLSEGMPLVVLEAMSHAIPVIASAVGEIPRLLAHAGSGRLVPPGDASALRTALLDALATPGRRDAQAAAFVATHHSSAAMAARYLDLYRDLTEDGHARRTA